MATPTQNQQQRINNIYLIQGSIGLLGSIGGIIHANKTGGKWYRYVGYFILGGLIFGIPARIATTPFINRILKEVDSTESK